MAKYGRAEESDMSSKDAQKRPSNVALLKAEKAKKAKMKKGKTKGKK
jgi:hypothetical protein